MMTDTCCIESIVDEKIKQGFASSRRGWAMSEILKKFDDETDRLYARAYILSMIEGRRST
jgi:hypothetical protein